MRTTSMRMSFFRGQYQANTSEALACRQYAERDKGGRWMKHTAKL